MRHSSHPAWVPVSSSAISALAYNEEAQELFVRFAPSGTEYVYSNVTVAQNAALVAAPSLGKHFNAEIKHTHTFRKLVPGGEQP